MLNSFRIENKETYKQLKSRFPHLTNKSDGEIIDGFIIKKLGNSYCIYSTLFENRPHWLIFMVTSQYVKAHDCRTENEWHRYKAAEIFNIPLE
ncbi:UBA domain-containing protein [Burkholderia cenocepacia]|uniref:hypothetical protein n=1 Tax=Burkholderia cenocepacia TaxID=95486 RepID=UPI0013DFAF46|nr:hypothetical protein [Burkholderia cenocepacia]MCW3583700.1 hypothetical protein [Burkholderia cenocepacia]MCW3629096.1 hypothetical protein [Burkholderia cenocepacia]MCW5185108.1 hypothetical protein [Burkholderia cenocepacia]